MLRGRAAIVGCVETWDRLRVALAALPAEAVATPTGSRVGAVLALFRDLGDDLELVYTRRRDDLRSHPGQISFPGGRVDPGETVEQAAVREAHEEVALDPATVTVLGRLPAFYIPPSRFWLQVVLAAWDAPHPLVAAEAEVAAVVPVRLSYLRDRRSWRAVRLSTSAWSWAWDLEGGHILWGATAMATAELLRLLDADWSGETTPADLPPSAQVRPWEALEGLRSAPAPGPPRLPGVRERHIGELPPHPPGAPDLARTRAAGTVIADAITTLLHAGPTAPTRPGRVSVLVGPGWTGAVGLAAAVSLARRRLPVTVVLAAPASGLPEPAALLLDEMAGAGAVAGVFDGALPTAAVVVDALVGRGLAGPLRAPALTLAYALRGHAATVVALDLPSGLDPTGGWLGELLPADVTIALAAPAPGLFRPGLSPFVGDLYLAPFAATAPPLLRLIPTPTGWRE